MDYIYENIEDSAIKEAYIKNFIKSFENLSSKLEFADKLADFLIQNGKEYKENIILNKDKIFEMFIKNMHCYERDNLNEKRLKFFEKMVLNINFENKDLFLIKIEEIKKQQEKKDRLTEILDSSLEERNLISENKIKDLKKYLSM